MNTNTIPLPFAPLTTAHDALIDYALPKAADRIAKFLTKRTKPGTSQQFDKEDFDEYCIQVGRKPYSNYWFKVCLDLLAATRLLVVERRFRGYGYQVRMYHPWQLDDWIVDEFKNTTSSDRYKNNYSKRDEKTSASSDHSSRQNEPNYKEPKKTCKTPSKTCKKSTSNPHSSVGDYRVSREKGNTKANQNPGDRTKSDGDAPKSKSDRPVTKPILKKTAFAAAPLIDYWLEEEERADGKEVTTSTAEINKQEKTATTGKKRTTPIDEINDTKKTAVSNTLKSDEHINSRQTQSTGLKKDLNVNSGNVDNASGNDKNNGGVDDKVNKKKKHNRPTFEVKINNKSWRSHLEELDQLGVTGNKTIVNALKTFSTEKVEAAIALYRVRKRETGYIENPCGYFMQALQEDWAGKKAKQVVNNDDPQSAEDQAALFRYWFELAKKVGYCSRTEERDGERWVCMSGTWERFIDAWSRGYTLEYLRKVDKRTNDP